MKAHVQGVAPVNPSAEFLRVLAGRYASASEFAADIARHLGNEPVLAGPPGVAYRTRKFVRRHQGLVAAGSAVALALLIGAVVSFVLYLKAAREQELAESESPCRGQQSGNRPPSRNRTHFRT